MRDLDNLREWQRGRYRKVRAEWLDGKVCAACGSSERLEADHIDPATKTMKSGTVWSCSKDRREAELALCQPLCKPCHDRKSNAEKLVNGGHNAAGYNRGCRCSTCRAAKNASNRKSLRRGRG